MQVLEVLHRNRQMTRSDIARCIGVNLTSVVRVVAGLVERNLVVANDRDEKRQRGRPSDLLTINPQAGYVVGLEYGRDHLIGVVVNAVGDVVVHEQVARPPAFETSPATTEGLAAAVFDITEKHGFDARSIKGVGIALHDVVDVHGAWATQDDPSATPFPVRDQLSARLGKFVFVEDVSRAFAFAEHEYGAGVGCSDMIYMFLGSHGVGGGIFVNDRMLISSTGLCGEIGHVIVDEAGELCQCGSRGCLETVASPERIVKQFEAYERQGVATSLRGAARLSFASICSAAGAGDKAALLALHPVATAMARALAPVVNVTGARVVVIGGRLRLAGDIFLSELSAGLRRRVIAGLAKHLSIRFAQLPEHAGAWGAANQALSAAWERGEFLPSVSREIDAAAP